MPIYRLDNAARQAQAVAMKVLLALLALGIVTLTGCKTADNTLFRPTVFTTNYVPDTLILVRTQRVDVVTVTNTIGTVTTNNVIVWQTNAVTVPAHEVVKPSAWVPNESTVGIVNTVGAATGPYGALGAFAVTAILGAWAQWRSKKYKDAAISLAQGAQQVIEAFPAQASQIKSMHKSVQNADGTRATVAAILAKQVVAKTTPTA